jgi:hypothetical protein
MMIEALHRASVAFPLNWSHRREYRPYESLRGQLGPYYIEWDPGHGKFGEGWDNSRFDAHGVLLTGRQRMYHPIRIAQYGLQQHSLWYKNGDLRSRAAFLAQSRWLLENQQRRRCIEGCYPFPFAWERYGAPAGFLSAMAQGEAVSLLLRAAQATGSETYIAAAIRAAEPFRHLIRDGGVTYTSRQDDVIFEEAASELASHILNGWIFASWGLFELQQYARWAGDLFDESAATLLRHLPLYDSGVWSYYCLLVDNSGFRRLATIKYHAFHIAQLHVMSSMTGNPEFTRTAERWLSYVGSLRSRAAVWANATRAAFGELTGRA